VILLRGLLRRYPSSWSSSALSFFVVFFVAKLLGGRLRRYPSS
jgi:hypothetical protein